MSTATHSFLAEDLLQLRILLQRRCASPEAALPVLCSGISFSPKANYERIALTSLSTEEQLIFLLGLAPHFDPALLDCLLEPETGISVSDTGGRRGIYHNGILPTVQTALFLLAGKNVAAKMEALRYFSPSAALNREELIRVVPTENGESIAASLLQVPDAVAEKIAGILLRENPLQLWPGTLHTNTHRWEELIFTPLTQRLLQQARQIITQRTSAGHEALPGIKLLLHGSSGTGKTTVAGLLAADAGKELLRVDIAQIRSRYTGETEKNLSRLFRKAEEQNMGLAFEDAEIFFGKSAPGDGAARPETSYLLQRLESFSGLLILTTRLASMIDTAFASRFHSYISFQLPDAGTRTQLWSNFLPSWMEVEDPAAFQMLSTLHEMSPAEIRSVAGECERRLLHRQEKKMPHAELAELVAAELAKTGRAFRGAGKIL